VTGLWHWLVHVTGCDYGLPYGHFSPYDFWSGVAGSFLVGVLTWFLLWYAHHTCRWSVWCLRYGHYPDSRGVRWCARHHPDHKGQKVTGELLHRLHHENGRHLAGGGAQATTAPPCSPS
jgi:hypothetical protein